jgi:hypothetical protein
MTDKKILVEWYDGDAREFDADTANLNGDELELGCYEDGFMDTSKIVPLFLVRLVTIEFTSNRIRRHLTDPVE